jgi:membrane protease YdiL (CAAX protease family)
VKVDSQHPKVGWRQNPDRSVTWRAKLRSLDFLEIAATYGLVLLALWTPTPLQTWLTWITLAWIVAATAASKLDARTLGFRPARLGPLLWVVGVAIVLATLAVWIAARIHTFHPLPSGTISLSRTSGYLLWAFLQQFLLQDFFLLRLLRLFPSKTTAVIAAAVLFASAHIPNPLLVVMTLLWGAAACALFVRYRDLYSLGIAHGILGICLAVTVPSAVHHDMRVGLGYFRYHPQRGPVHRSQSNHIVSTHAWVMADAIRR